MKVIKKSHKPFKSGLQIATVRGTIKHPELALKGKDEEAYLFYEDDSYVAVKMCEVIEP
jgi:hypothetical protein